MVALSILPHTTSQGCGDVTVKVRQPILHALPSHQPVICDTWRLFQWDDTRSRGWHVGRRRGCCACHHCAVGCRYQESVPPAMASNIVAFIEGDVFKGSRQMPLEDLLAAMPDDYRIPGLPAVHSGAYWCIFFKSPCGEMPRCTSRQRV